MGLFDNINEMWFGTERRMGWIPTPNTGAGAGSVGVFVESNLLRGGGHTRSSWDSHKEYAYNWGESASQSLVSRMQGYRNGSFGRGLLYFLDPMFYLTNLLPKRWADPSMAVNREGEPLVRDQWPTGVPQVDTANGYPVDGAAYTLPAGYTSQNDGTEIAIPIPPGFTLALGAVYSGAGEVYYRTSAGVTALTPLGLADPVVTNASVSGQDWVYLGLRNTSGSPAQITLGGMTARAGSLLTTDLAVGPWYAGEGHSGCRFQSDPTVVEYNGVGGGQLGLAVNFKEVGAWE